MKKKICVYTCITGNYDNLHEIEYKEKNVDYICFTNNKNIVSNTWNIVYIKDNKLDNQRLSRKLKMIGHPMIDENYDISVWMDASVVFKKSVVEFVNKYLKKNSFAAIKHHARKCIYEEAIECIKQRKDDRKVILEHMDFLKNENYPENNGLYEMTVFIKKHNDPVVIKTMKLWFDMICNHSKRDQLSFMYCVWKTGLKIDSIDINVWDNTWFSWIKHNPTKKIEVCRVLFIKDSYDYNYDLDYTYKVKDNKYYFDAKIPCDTDYIKIFPSNAPCTIYKNMKISYSSQIRINIFNTIKYKDYDVFYNDVPFIEVFGNFKKGDKIRFEAEYFKFRDDEIYNLIDYLGYNYKCELDINTNLSLENKKLMAKYNDKKEELTRLKNSRGWKFIERIRKVKYQIFKR